MEISYLQCDIHVSRDGAFGEHREGHAALCERQVDLSHPVISKVTKHGLSGWKRRSYLVPIKQEAIHEPPNDALALCSPLFLELLKFSDPLFTDCVVDCDIFLFVEVVVASVVWWDLANFLYVL